MRLHSRYNDFDFVYCFLLLVIKSMSIENHAEKLNSCELLSDAVNSKINLFWLLLVNANSDAELYRKTILFFKRIFYRIAFFFLIFPIIRPSSEFSLFSSVERIKGDNDVTTLQMYFIHAGGGSTALMGSEIN